MSDTSGYMMMNRGTAIFLGGIALVGASAFLYFGYTQGIGAIGERSVIDAEEGGLTDETAPDKQSETKVKNSGIGDRAIGVIRDRIESVKSNHDRSYQPGQEILSALRTGENYFTAVTNVASQAGWTEARLADELSIGIPACENRDPAENDRTAPLPAELLKRDFSEFCTEFRNFAQPILREWQRTTEGQGLAGPAWLESRRSRFRAHGQERNAGGVIGLS